MNHLENLAIKVWGKRLKAYGPDALDGIEVSEATRAFLLKVGVPRITTDSELVTLYAKPHRAQVGGEAVLQIGDDFGTAFCIKLGSDAVWSVDMKGELPTRFVNSSVAAMLVFISLHKKYSMRMDETASEGEFRAVADELTSEFTKLDQPALASEDTYWSLIIEQTRDGLI